MRLPVDGAYKTGPTGRYGADRGDVTHWGIDLHRPGGDPVYAPEDMEVWYVAVNDKTRPLTGYGPAAIIARGSSGFFHVLGHMDPWKWSKGFAHLLPYKGRRYKEGDLVGYVAPKIKPPHVHWEMRTVGAPPRGVSRGRYTIDPILYLQTGEAKPLPDSTAGRGGGQSAVLLLLLLAALASGKRRSRR